MSTLRRPLAIVITFDSREAVAASTLESVLACAGELIVLGARLVLIDVAPVGQATDPKTSAALDRVREVFSDAVHSGTEGTGVPQCRTDIILLGRGTIIFPGSLIAMVAAAGTDPMIAFVNPQTNAGANFGLLAGRSAQGLAPDEAHHYWLAMSRTLPDVIYAPLAQTSALFVRGRVLAEFGAPNGASLQAPEAIAELVMRAGRCGYRAAIANRAFVWRSDGPESFPDLESRYPEHGRLISEWREGAEQRSETLLSALVPNAAGRLRVAFDFSSFQRNHSGTQKAGIQLLNAAFAGWRDAFEVCVLCNDAVFEFHRLDALGVKRFDPHGVDTFAAIFRVGQPYERSTIQRLALKGATVGVLMLDTISIDAAHMRSAEVFDLWQVAIDRFDFIVYNSAFTLQQFQRRFAGVDTRPRAVSRHSLDIDDYGPGGDGGDISDAVRDLAEGYILVFGNAYPHKGVAEAALRLAVELPDQRIVALGATRSPACGGLPDLPNLSGFASGELSDADIDALQVGARVIVMPSHYEGFGFPLLGALARRRPFIARATPALEEVHAALGRNPNVHFYETTPDLITLMRAPLAWIDAVQPASLSGDSSRLAADIRRMIEAAIAGTSYARILQRVRAIQTITGERGVAASDGLPADHPAAAARRLGLWVERAADQLFRSKGVYTATRAVYRLGLWIGFIRRQP